MTAYPVYRDEPQALEQQPPAYTPSPTISPRSTFNNNTADAVNADAAPATREPSTFNKKFHSITSKAGWPLNKAANVIGAEGWWPTSMEKECGKAARILHSFTKLNGHEPPKQDGPMHPTGITKKSMVKIPDSVLENCAGLAIFNVIRAGAVHASLAAGSGVVVARRPDGSWSPPSSFVVSTLGAGFAIGLDVYDCVCVLNTPAQVNAFANPRVSLGGDASIAVGPVGAGGSVDAAVSKTARPMWSYMKSRGLWAGVQIDGTIIVSRADANSVFYNERGITAKKILRGDVAWPEKGKPLFEVLRAIEGRADFDRNVVREVGRMATPGDAVINDNLKRDATAEVEHRERESGETVLDEKERLAKSGY
ncbi:las17-binding protein actin regulator domain-containing protein [Hirsutella rhossiliensis]